MKNLMVAALASMAVAFPIFAEMSADVLIWNVDTTQDAASYDGATRNFDSIKFWAVDSNGDTTDLTGLTYLGPDYLLDTPNEGIVGSGGAIANFNGVSTSDGDFYTNLSGYDSGYTFMAELYLNGSTIDRMLMPLSWSDFGDALVRNLTTDQLDYYLDSVTPYNMASTMVPEPSSGLLLVIGGALLALRRRRAA